MQAGLLSLAEKCMMTSQQASVSAMLLRQPYTMLLFSPQWRQLDMTDSSHAAKFSAQGSGAERSHSHRHDHDLGG